MKRLCLLAIAGICGLTAHAQLAQVDNIKNSMAVESKDTAAWLYGGTLTLGLNEGFLHNWSAGGELAAVSINGIGSAYLTRLYHNQIWSTNLEAAYSLYYAYSNSFIPRKADDRIDFTSKYGTRLDSGKHFFLTGLLNFKSQFTKGYDYSRPNWDTMATSRFLSPSYTTLALGLEYRRGEVISLFLSPLAGRLTTASKTYTTWAPEGAFGIPYGKTVRGELGAYFSGRYQVNLSKSLAFRTRLDLYANYLAKNKKDSLGNIIMHDNPGNVDIYCDNTLIFKPARHFSFTIGLTAIYDNDIPYSSTYADATGAQVKKNEPANQLGWWQIKQVLTFGLIFKM